MTDADILTRKRGLGRSATHAQLARAYQAQKGKCFYCKCEAVLPDTKFRRANPRSGDWPRNVATREHLVRQSEGGSDEDSNVVMACAKCNWARG